MDGLISPLDHWRNLPAFPAAVWMLPQGLISAFIPLGFGEWQISLFLRLIQALTSLSDSYVRAWKSFITEISPKPIRGLDCCVSVLLLQQSTPPPQLSGWKHHLFVDGVAIRAGLPGDGSSLLRWCQLGWLDSRWKRHFHTWPSSHGRWVGIGSWLSVEALVPLCMTPPHGWIGSVISSYLDFLHDGCPLPQRTDRHIHASSFSSILFFS